MPSNPFQAALQRRLTPLALAIPLALAALSGGLAHADQGIAHYDIPAGPLAGALNRFAQQAGVAVVVDAQQVQGLTCEGLSGDYGIEEGFNRLLRGSGLAVAKTAAGYGLVPAPRSADEARVLKSMRVTAAAPEENSSAGSYAFKAGRGATGMNLSLRETPQSVFILTRAQMDDFRLNSVNDALEAAPGLVVERVETDRTYYTARGFNITNFQEDGIGVAFPHGLVGGDLDTIIYDRVEVVRGANGLLSGTGNPSATVNFIRKRPTEVLQAALGASYGSWNNRRLEADVASPFDREGRLRGRVVAAAQDADSYLDRYSHSRNTFYGVLEADVGEHVTLSAGHTYLQNKADGHLWGGLPMYYSDGTLTHFDRSTNTAADWSHWYATNQISFLEGVYHFDNDWELRAIYTHKKIEWDGKLFYVSGVPDRATGLGSFSYPAKYNTVNKQDVLDVRASGRFELAGREHDLILGGNLSISRVDGLSMAGDGVALPPLEQWHGDTPQPDFNVKEGAADFVDRQRSAYFAARLNLGDALKLIVGANATDATSTGSNYGTSRRRSELEITPYVGAVYDLSATLSAYASYTEIFTPQSEVGADFRTLDPVTGKNYEAGLKAELFDQRLLGTLSLFRSEQSNLPNRLGMIGSVTVFEATEVTSQGVELELSGQLGERLQVAGGYTRLWLEDGHGDDARLYTPRQIFRVTATYRVPGIDALKVGANLGWRSQTSSRGAALPAVTVRQPAYALLNLMARYDFSEHLFGTLNLNNVTDKRYLASLYWADQGYYGAPRNASVSLTWKY